MTTNKSILLFIFFFLVLISACDRDPFSEEPGDQSFYFRTEATDKNEVASNLIKNLKSEYGLAEQAGSRTASTSFGEVLTDSVAVLNDPETNTTNYAFTIKTRRSEGLVFEDLVFEEVENGYRSFIVRYEPEEEHIAESLEENRPILQNFTGNITFKSLDGTAIENIRYKKGVAVGTNNGRTAGCASGAYLSCEGGFYDDTGLWTPLQCYIFVIMEHCEADRFHYFDPEASGGAYYPQPGGSSGYSGGGSGGGLPNTVDANPELLAWHWQHTHISTTTEFDNIPCFKDVFTELKSNNEFHDVLEAFFGEASDFQIIFDVGENLEDEDSDEVNGRCHLPNDDNEIIIEIDKDMLPVSPPLVIARTMMHEAIHAELHRRVREILASGAEPVCEDETPTDFEDLWCYYKHYGTGTYQHEFMADHYVATIANALAELKDELSTQEWVDYVEGKDYWDWNEFFTYIAWMGLHKTEEFEDQIESDNNKHKKYGDYNLDSNQDVKCN